MQDEMDTSQGQVREQSTQKMIFTNASTNVEQLKKISVDEILAMALELKVVEDDRRA
jgi:hypothetical protein